MFKIKDGTIHCSRGDGGTITLKIPITDANDYMKYEDASNNVYWYNTKKKKLYDSEYIESSVSIDTLNAIFYQFQNGDKIKFNIYNKNGYDKDPLMTKEIEVNESKDSVDIPLNEENTTFDKAVNKPTIYWYDVTLNDCMTVVCYNEDGAREFILYPAKGDEE